MERINVTRANPRYTHATEKNGYFARYFSIQVSRGGSAVRYSTIRAMQFPVGLHRVHTAAYTEGGVSGGFHAAGGRAARVGASAASEKRVSRPVTDGPRQT